MSKITWLEAYITITTISSFKDEDLTQSVSRKEGKTSHKRM